MRNATIKISTVRNGPSVAAATSRIPTPAASGPMVGMNSSAIATTASRMPKGILIIVKKMLYAMNALSESSISARI